MLQTVRNMLPFLRTTTTFPRVVYQREGRRVKARFYTLVQVEKMGIRRPKLPLRPTPHEIRVAHEEFEDAAKKFIQDAIPRGGTTQVLPAINFARIYQQEETYLGQMARLMHMEANRSPESPRETRIGPNLFAVVIQRYIDPAEWERQKTQLKKYKVSVVEKIQ